MKPRQNLALISPGAVSVTAFVRFPGLSSIVTDVWAPSPRQSSRIANGFRDCRAARSIAELSGAGVYLVCSKPPADLLGVHKTWRGKTVLIAADGLDRGALQSFADRGAATASVLVFDVLTPCHFFIEGDDTAVSAASRLFDAAGGQSIGIIAGSRPFAEATALLTSSAALGVMGAAMHSLLQTGLPPWAVRELVERLTARTLRSLRRSGARTWKPPESAELSRLMGELESRDPALAAYLRQLMSVNAELMKSTPSRRQALALGGGKSRAGHTD